MYENSCYVYFDVDYLQGRTRFWCNDLPAWLPSNFQRHIIRTYSIYPWRSMFCTCTRTTCYVNRPLQLPSRFLLSHEIIFLLYFQFCYWNAIKKNFLDEQSFYRSDNLRQIPSKQVLRILEISISGRNFRWLKKMQQHSNDWTWKIILNGRNGVLMKYKNTIRARKWLIFIDGRWKISFNLVSWIRSWIMSHWQVC